MWKEMEIGQFGENVFSLIHEQWMLVSAGSGARVNTMTASWGSLGVLWNRPAATCYIRPQRYTREFLDNNEYFTLSFFTPDYKPQLALCGSKSGREVDKVKECGFTVLRGEGDAPYFDQARLVMVCRKLLVQQMEAEKIPEAIRQEQYPGEDYHYLYIGEIRQLLCKE